MNTELYHKINGYLEGLSQMSTHFGNCYGHEYLFSEIDQPIDKAVKHYNETSNLGRHNDIKYLPLLALDNWKDTLFKLTADWFFFAYRMNNLQVKIAYADDDGNFLPEEAAEFDKGSNKVSNRLIELIEQFIGGREVQVFRMITECEEKNEFDWEQLYFVIDNKAFVMDFYQWG